MGDWKADMLKPKSPDTRIIQELIDELSLKLLQTGPSHHTANKGTWINVILVDDNDTIWERELPRFPAGTTPSVWQ